MPFIGTQPEVGGYSVLDNLTASATASYTLQKDSANFIPSSANQLLVSLNGVIQKPGSSFTVSGSTLTFSSALTSNDSIDFILAMGEPLLVGTPSDGTVTSSKLATDIAISGHAAVGANIIAGTRALSIAGATDGSSSEILNCFNSSLASKFSVRDDGIINAANLIIAPTGIRIGGSAQGNTLDDYEEGTFTATLVATGSTFQYSYQTGRYTKVGNLVNFNLYIQLDGGGNSFVGNAVTITGMPFANRNNAADSCRFYVHGRYLNVAGTGYNYVYAHLGANSTTLSLNMGGDNVPGSALPATYLSSSSGQLVINGHYFTDS